MMMMIPPDDSIPQFPGDSNWCPHAYHAEKLYLYDGDALLATFNQNDEVEDVFVNGPTGRMASYFLNDDDRLYFYLNDNLGSPRVVVDSTGQTQYYVYHPFGAVRYSEGNHGTQYQFTGKERDEHGYFEFDYFGARYYDSRIGSFSSIDKSGQFASGYVYGANNPVIGVDPDGNIFFLSGSFIIGALLGGGSYAATTDNFQLDKFLGYAALGGLSGYAGSYVKNLSQVASTATASSINSVGSSLIDNTPLNLSFGFGSITEGKGWSFANPFKGGSFMDKLSAASGWVALAQDLNKIDYYASTTPEERAQTDALRARVEADGETIGQTTHIKTSSDEVSDISFSKSSGDIPTFSRTDMDRTVRTEVFRSKAFHLKTTIDVDFSKATGKISGFSLGEIHFNRVPSRGLFGVGVIPHAAVDGNHVQFLNRISYGVLGNLLAPAYGFRDMAVNMFEPYHRYRHALIF